MKFFSKIGAFLLCIATTIASPAQKRTTLHSFDSTDGQLPGQLVQGTDGKLYATTAEGGASGYGTVFTITTSGNFGSLLSFSGSNGSAPSGLPLVQGANGNFYGTTEGGGAYNNGTVFEITPSGKLNTLYSFCAQSNCPDGNSPTGLILAADGNFYGTTAQGGANESSCSGGCGTVFKITPAGVLATLYSFCSKSGCTDGDFPTAAPIQATDGNLYGTTHAGGASGNGTLYRITLSGRLTTLFTFDGTDGSAPKGLIQASNGYLYGGTNFGGKGNACTNGCGTIYSIALSGTLVGSWGFDSTNGHDPTTPIQATDGNFYGTTLGGANGEGTIYRLTPGGELTTLYTFCTQSGCPDGSTPVGVMQDTNGELYGTTFAGGSSHACAGGCGTIYSLSVGLTPFVELRSTSGTVGSKIGILGQGFSSSSVVKFNGAKATTVTLTGTTYLLATVPAGASDGYVTVTTGTTTLKSRDLFVVHNSWGSAAATPTAVASPATGVLGNAIYVVGGRNGTTIYDDNQIYNSATNKWSTGAALPATTYAAASAVVNNILYVMGGTTNGTNVIASVWAYNPKTNTWASKAAMPTARAAAVATVENGIIYVIGGADVNFKRLTTVESYNPAINTWKEEAPLMVGKSYPSVGLVGSTIVVADGVTSSGDTGDNEGFDASTNAWSLLKDDPTGRDLACAGSVIGELYVAGGRIYGKGGVAESLTESFALPKDTWTTLASMPQATQSAGSAVYGGQLYCFGGTPTQGGASIANVQIYQP